MGRATSQVASDFEDLLYTCVHTPLLNAETALNALADLLVERDVQIPFSPTVVKTNEREWAQLRQLCGVYIWANRELARKYRPVGADGYREDMEYVFRYMRPAPIDRDGVKGGLHNPDTHWIGGYDDRLSKFRDHSWWNDSVKG